MDDLISRQAAIDAVCMEWCNVKHQDCKHQFDVEKDDYYWCDGCETVLNTLPGLPSAQSVDQFEHDIHAMFDHIWDCEIDHPIFQDTVGELMMAVIQCYKKSEKERKE